MAATLQANYRRIGEDVKLTPITENEDGSNNYSEFRIRAKIELVAHEYWKYVDGDDYKPPTIPDLRPAQIVAGLDAAGNPATITVPDNQVAVNMAKSAAEAWSRMDKCVLAAIAKAVPVSKLYLVEACRSAREAWFALKEKYEPSNTFTAMRIKQTIIGNACVAGDDPVRWRKVMVELYGRLVAADPTVMPDDEFAKHLVTLMDNSDEWRSCRDSLREKLRAGRMPSNQVLQILKDEEFDKGLDASMVSINSYTLVAGTGVANANASVYSTASNANTQLRKEDRGKQRQANRPAPYNSQQRFRGPQRICENSFCETPIGHLKDDCFSYGGGKAGKYPEGFRGRKDVHLSPRARVAARRKLALEGMSRSGGSAGGA